MLFKCYYNKKVSVEEILHFSTLLFNVYKVIFLLQDERLIWKFYCNFSCTLAGTGE